MTNVIINDVLPLTQSVATGGQTVYSTNWTANVAADVIVYSRPANTTANDATQVVSTSAYTVAFIGGLRTVQVTLSTPSTLGDIVTITRNTPADYLNLYTNTNFVSSMLNNDFGILTLVDQQNQLVNQQVAPRYNYSAFIVPITDTILPILGANQIWVKNTGNTAIVPLTVPTSGFGPAASTYVLLTPDANLPNSLAMSTLDDGIMINDTGANTIITRTFTGTSGQIVISNATGVAGNINVAIASNPIIPGTAGMGIPEGTTAQRVTPLSNIGLRYNTDLAALEYWNGTTWSQLSDNTFVNPGLINQLAWYAATGDTISGLATINNGVLLTSAGGAPTWLTNGTAGYVLTANSGAPPSWQAVSASGAVEVVDGDAGSITPTAGVITISGGSTGLTTSGSGSTLDLLGTLAVGFGGTSKTSVTVAPAATSWAGWDANKNMSANSFIEGYATTATAAMTTTLVVGSAYQQFFTGTTTQILQMPVAATLVIGQGWYVVNNSTGAVTVQSSGGNTIGVMTGNSSAFVTCILNSGTTAASWSIDMFGSGGGSGTVNAGTSGQLAYYASSTNAVSGTNAGTGVLTALGVNVGSAGAFVTFNGAGGTPSSINLTNATGYPFVAPTIQQFTSSSGTYTRPTNPTPLYLRVTVKGGGGSGGISAGGAGAGGGGEGGTSVSIITSPSATYTYAVGAASGSGVGGNNSTFSAGSMVGGGGGTNFAGGEGGAGGTASGGNLFNIIGNCGGNSGYQGSPYFGGCGGGTGGGQGGTNIGGASAGAANSGGGGGGASSVNAGAIGGSGLVTIEEYYQ